MRSMTIGKQLFLSFGAALALTLVVGVVSFSSIGSLDTTVTRIAKVTARKQFLAGEINGVMSDILSLERAILCRAFMKDTATIGKYNQEFHESAARAKKHLDEFTSLVETREGRQMLAEMQSGVERAGQNHEELIRLALNDTPEASAKHVTDKVLPVVLLTRAAGVRLVGLQQELTQAAAAAAGVTVSWARWLTSLMIGLSILVAVVVVLIVRGINQRLRNTVAELNEGAGQTASAAGQVSSASQSLAQGSSEQAASLEETSASSEEISSMARKNSDNSRVAAELVTQSQQKFTATNRSLEQMVGAMGQINEASDKISKIIKTIDEIAFQTNILALNAAVEAARAGEAGMGFAVVADEVRSLSQRCAQAAKDTAELIEDSIVKSNDGKAKVDQVAVAFREIIEMSGKVKTLVDEVNLGSQEQARGIEQIGKAIVQMEHVTQGTAAGAEESASAAEELTAQSETLRDIVRQLSAMVGGGNSGPAPVDRRDLAASRASAPAPRRQPERASASLAALRKATAQKLAGREHEPVGVGRSGKTAGPADDDFLDF